MSRSVQTQARVETGERHNGYPGEAALAKSSAEHSRHPEETCDPSMSMAWINRQCKYGSDYGKTERVKATAVTRTGEAQPRTSASLHSIRGRQRHPQGSSYSQRHTGCGSAPPAGTTQNGSPAARAETRLRSLSRVADRHIRAPHTN